MALVVALPRRGALRSSALLRLLRGTLLLLSCLLLNLRRTLLRLLLLRLVALLDLLLLLSSTLLGLLRRALLCRLLALLHLLLLSGALLGALLLGLLALCFALLLHLLTALLGRTLRRPLLGTLLLGLLALRLALLLQLLATLLGDTLLGLLLLGGALLFGLLALSLTLLLRLLAALLGNALLGLLRGTLLGGLLALRVTLLAHQLTTLVGGALRLEHMLAPSLIAPRGLLLQLLLPHRRLLTGHIAPGIGLRALSVAHLLLRCLLLLTLLDGALLPHLALGLLLQFRRTLRLLDLAGAPAAIARQVKLRRWPRTTLALPGGEALRRPLADGPFGLEAPAFLGRIALAIGLPVGLALARLAPVGTRRRNHRAACRPLRRSHAATVAVLRRQAERPRPGIIARSGVRLTLCLGRREVPTLAVIDARNPPVAIAIGVVWIAHEIGIVGARLVIIIAIAVVDRLGISHVIATGLPRPGLDAVIIEIIIGRCVADRVADPVGAVDPRVAIVIGRFGVTERSNCRECRRARRIADWRRRPLGQRLDLRQRRQGRECLRVHGIVDAGLPILLSARGKHEGERSGAGKPQRDVCLSGHGEYSSGC
jgi:hypothetical protein